LLRNGDWVPSLATGVEIAGSAARTGGQAFDRSISRRLFALFDLDFRIGVWLNRRNRIAGRLKRLDKTLNRPDYNFKA